MEPLRVIQVGTKHDHAADAALTCKELPEVFTLEGVIEEDAQQRSRAAQNPDYTDIPFLSWEEALQKKPDAFIIETAEHDLVPNAMRALRAGYPVHMDKPGSEDRAAFHQMCDLAKEKKLVLSLGYMYRYNAAVLYAKQLVSEGKLGEIISVEAHMSCSYADPEKRKWLGNFKGGMLYFLGCHLIDLVVSICGFPQEIIPLNAKTMLGGMDSVDYGFCAYRYPNGISFVKSNATECNGFDRRQLVITGSKGTLEIKPLEITVGGGRLYKATYARETFGTDEKWVNNSRSLKFDAQKRYDRMFIQFAKYVRGQEENPFSYDYEAKLHDVIMDSCEA